MANSVSIEKGARMSAEEFQATFGGKPDLRSKEALAQLAEAEAAREEEPTFGQPSPPGEKAHACPPRIEIDGRMILTAWVLLVALGVYLIDRIF